MKRDNPCSRCGWKYGFHVCVDLSRPCPEEAQTKAVTARTRQPRPGERTERNKEMLDKYQAGATYKQLSEEYEISRMTAQRIVQRTAQRSNIELRDRAYANRYTAGGSHGIA